MTSVTVSYRHRRHDVLRSFVGYGTTLAGAVLDCRAQLYASLTDADEWEPECVSTPATILRDLRAQNERAKETAA